MMKGLKNVSITDTRAQMTFCASCKTCPAIDISKDSDKVIVGGKDEGYTHFTKEQFALFVKTVKEGVYDKYLLKDCECGQTSNEDGSCDGSHTNVCKDSELDLNEDVPFGD
jgi:CDGSH-type Zn-finger protein